MHAWLTSSLYHHKWYRNESSNHTLEREQENSQPSLEVWKAGPSSAFGKYIETRFQYFPGFRLPELVFVVLTMLKNMKVNGKDDIPYMMENKKMIETTNQWKLLHNNFPKRWPKGSQILEIHQFEPLPSQRDDKRTCRCHVFRQVFLPASFSNSITPVSKLSGFNNSRYLILFNDI